MSQSNPSYIVIGKFGATYGIHGWIKILAYTEFGENILNYQPWYIQRTPDTWTPISIEDGRLHNNGVIVKPSNVHTPEEARLLTGYTIAITRDQLPPLKKNEFYWSDLIGITVINQHGETLGKIAYLMETGSNDVIVVKGEKEHAIPYLMDTVIKSIDLDKREMHVDWELI